MEMAKLSTKIDEMKVEQQEANKAQQEAKQALQPVIDEYVILRQKRLVPWGRVSQRTKKEDQVFKSKLKEYYERTAGKKHKQLKCQILDKVANSEFIIGAHIWKRATNGAGLEEFGLTPSDIDNTRNGLLLTKGIEVAFDQLRVCFLYDMVHSRLILRLADDTIADEFIEHSDPPKKFSDIVDRELLCPKNKLPYRRLLSWHAFWAMKQFGKLGDYRPFQKLSMSARGYRFPDDVDMDQNVAMMEAAATASDDDDDGSSGQEIDHESR